MSEDLARRGREIPNTQLDFQAPSAAIGIIILAAGRSRRMGQPKLLLPWGETSVLGHLIAQWRTLDARQIAVVCAHDDHVIASELDRLQFPTNQRIFNSEPERGMFSSIQCAARWPGWKADLTHFTFVLGDQPNLRESTLRMLLDFVARNPQQVCQPSSHGHRRHPVALPKTAFQQLAISTAAHLKEFLTSFAVATPELNDPGMELDIDRPEDYERARRHYFGAPDA